MQILNYLSYLEFLLFILLCLIVTAVALQLFSIIFPSFLELVKSIDLHRPLFPQHQDLIGAVEAFFRLQEVYLITARQITDGELSVNYPHVIMNTEDCFQVGLVAYQSKDFARTKEWISEALRKYQPGIYSSYLTINLLKEFIAWGEYEVSS